MCFCKVDKLMRKLQSKNLKYSNKKIRFNMPNSIFLHILSKVAITAWMNGGSIMGRVSIMGGVSGMGQITTSTTGASWQIVTG